MYETGKEQFNAEDKKYNQGLNKNYIIIGIELKTSNHCIQELQFASVIWCIINVVNLLLYKQK